MLEIRHPCTARLEQVHRPKGSIAVNGVSLTINSIAQDVFSLNLIPHTLENTTLQFLAVGSLVNLEVDQIARYVDRMAQWANE